MLGFASLSREDADFRENPNGEGNHPRGGVLRHNRQRRGEDPRQRR